MSRYNAVPEPAGRTRVSFWAHVRRRHSDATSTAPLATEVLTLILEVYRMEQQAKAA